VRNRVESQNARQHDAPGLRQVPTDRNPHHPVLNRVGVKDKQEITTVPRAGYGDPYWGGRWGPMYDDIVVTNYREGTLIIDLLDAQSKDLVWRTYLVRALSDDPDRNLRGADGSEKAFREFPPTAGRNRSRPRACRRPPTDRAARQAFMTSCHGIQRLLCAFLTREAALRAARGKQGQTS
jgi:hypothetical protein